MTHLLIDYNDYNDCNDYNGSLIHRANGPPTTTMTTDSNLDLDLEQFRELVTLVGCTVDYY